MIITKMALPRRTFLRGVGATLALPLLDAMVPAATAMARTVAQPTPRLGFIYSALGTVHQQWTPSAVGPAFELSPILSPLAPVRDRLLVLSGLAHHQADSMGDGSNPHARASAVWLSGVHAYTNTEGAEIKLATTADQIAAAKIGHLTPLASLELTAETVSSASCDSGKCVYSNTISWRTPTTPLPMEFNPRAIFERLFGDGGTTAQRLVQMKKDASLLDSVIEETGRLGRTLGSADQTRLSEYLDSIRDVEQRIQQAEQHSDDALIELPERPRGTPDAFEEHVKLLFDLQVLAYEADVTRICSMLLTREQTARTYPNIGVPDGHHAVSHHRDDPALMEKKSKIDTYHIQLLDYYLERLKATPDGDGSLLDHAMILYGSGLANPNLHTHYDLPLLLAGSGAGRLKSGRHLKFGTDTPMTNLLLTMLDKVGVPLDRLSDSTGLLSLETLSGV